MKESTLPKWAQEELRRLRGEVESWRQKALSFAAGDALTDTQIHADGCDFSPLPSGTRVRFWFVDRGDVGDRGDVTRYCDVAMCGSDSDASGRHLTVRGGDSIAVYPHASNTIIVRMARQ